MGPDGWMRRAYLYNLGANYMETEKHVLPIGYSHYRTPSIRLMMLYPEELFCQSTMNGNDLEDISYENWLDSLE